MPPNDEQLNLVISETGADAVSSKLAKLDAAAQKVVKTSKAQDAANKAEVRSLLDLDKQVQKTTKLFTDYATAKSKAAKAGKEGSSGGFDLGKVERGLNSSAALLGNNPVSEGVRLIGDITGALGDFNPVALAAAAGAAVVTTALKAMSDSADRAAAAQQYAIDEFNKNVDIVFNAKDQAQQKTREQLAADYDNIQADLDLTNQKLQAARDRKAAIDADFAALGSSLNPQARSDLGRAGQTELDEIKRLEEAARGLSTQLTTTTFAMNDTTLATKEQEAQQLAAAQDHLAAMTRNQQLSARLAELVATGTSEQIQSRIDGITREIGVLEQYQQAAIEYAQTLEQGSEANRLASAQAEAYGDQIETLLTEQDALTGSTLDLVKAREAEAKAIEYQKKQAEELAETVKKSNEELARLNEQDAASRDKLRESLLSIVEEAEKAAQDALNSLIEARNEIAQDAGREEDKAARDAATERINIQIDSYRQELDALKSYKRKIRDIEQAAADAQFDLILNRDFSGLFSANRNTEIAKRDAGTSERDAIEDVREARDQQNADLIRSLETERQERAIALQQRLQDAQAAYQAEQVQIANNRRDSEAKANAQRVKEKAAIDQQYNYIVQTRNNELLFISRTEQERFNIIAQTQNALVAQARATLAAISGASNGGSTQSGASSSFSQTNHIYGSNMESVGNLIDARTRKLIQGYFT